MLFGSFHSRIFYRFENVLECVLLFLFHLLSSTAGVLLLIVSPPQKFRCDCPAFQAETHLTADTKGSTTCVTLMTTSLALLAQKPMQNGSEKKSDTLLSRGLN